MESIFSTVPQKDYLNFGDNVPQAVVDLLSLSIKDVAKMTDVAESSVRFDTKIPKSVKVRLEEIGVICQLVAEHFTGDIKKTQTWFQTTNPFLGNWSPRDLIRIGKYKKLMQFILDADGEKRRA
jgi:hypothetical protein